MTQQQFETVPDTRPGSGMTRAPRGGVNEVEGSRGQKRLASGTPTGGCRAGSSDGLGTGSANAARVQIFGDMRERDRAQASAGVQIVYQLTRPPWRSPAHNAPLHASCADEQPLVPVARSPLVCDPPTRAPSPTMSERESCCCGRTCRAPVTHARGRHRQIKPFSGRASP